MWHHNILQIILAIVQGHFSGTDTEAYNNSADITVAPIFLTKPINTPTYTFYKSSLTLFSKQAQLPR